MLWKILIVTIAYLIIFALLRLLIGLPLLLYLLRELKENWNPCGGGVEYLHRDPASSRRRRNSLKSEIIKDSSGEDQQDIQKTDPSSRQRRRPTKNKTVTVKE
jgi:hypothetical protein